MSESATPSGRRRDEASPRSEADARAARSTPSAEPPPPKRGGKPPGLALRPVVDSTLDADSAWLRASVEAFEPRLRELEQREREPAGPGAWSQRPDLGCGWTCDCCPRRPAGQAVLNLDRWREPAPWDPRRWLGGRGGDALAQRLARAAASSEPVVLGADCDPYGGDAAHRARTRSLLDAFRGLEGAELAITTASPLVLCDLDLLAELDRTSSLSVEMVVPSADAGLVRRLEPGAAGPGERLGALEEVASQGVAARLRIAPLLPGLNTGEAALGSLVERAARAGAVDVAASPLRLPLLRFNLPAAIDGSTRRSFFAWLAAQEPELLAVYRRLYRFRSTLPTRQRELLQVDLDRLRLAHGFPRGGAGRS